MVVLASGPASGDFLPTRFLIKNQEKEEEDGQSHTYGDECFQQGFNSLLNRATVVMTDINCNIIDKF